jgi:GNAT superfamily N-acetyltransferase
VTEWRSQRLNDDHDLSQFDCGNAVLNRWLVEHARQADQDNTSRTYVWVESGSHVVRAYYSVCPTQVTRTEVGRAMAGRYSVAPAYLLAKLALDAKFHGQGLGGQLLLDAIEVIVVSADRGGGRLVVVDAIDDQAAAFYRRYDFKQVKDNPRRLVLKVSTARAAIGLESLHVVSDGQVALSSATLTRADGSQVHMFVDSNDLRRVADRLHELSDQPGPVDITQVIIEVLGQSPPERGSPDSVEARP